MFRVITLHQDRELDRILQLRFSRVHRFVTRKQQKCAPFTRLNHRPGFLNQLLIEAKRRWLRHAFRKVEQTLLTIIERAFPDAATMVTNTKPAGKVAKVVVHLQCG